METLPETDPPETRLPAREDRFTELAARVAEPLRRYAVRRTDPETAQDVVADALLVLWRRLDDVPSGDPLPWAYAVTRRCLANSTRASQRHLRLVDRLARQPAPEPPEGMTGETADIDPGLDAALARLPAADRELLRLWAWEDLEPREIAVVLEITANAASIRLHRAKKRLAGLLGKDDAGPGQEQGEERRHP